MKIIAGGIIKKDNKFLLVQENKEKCIGQWNVPAGKLEENETLIECAKREIYEETGCEVEITGLLEIINEVLEGVNVIVFLFDTKLINENIKVDEKEISNVKWFSYEDILNMRKELRADGYFLSTLKNKVENIIYPIEIIKTISIK